jgi:hypothetical protein
MAVTAATAMIAIDATTGTGAETTATGGTTAATAVMAGIATVSATVDRLYSNSKPNHAGCRPCILCRCPSGPWCTLCCSVDACGVD